MIGIGLELFGVIIAVWDTGHANQRAASIESTNSLLALAISLTESNNLVLYKQVQPRRITPEQKTMIRGNIREQLFKYDVPQYDVLPKKREALIRADAYDTEARVFAREIGRVLADGGFNVAVKEDMVVGKNLVFGLSFSAATPHPRAFDVIAKAFGGIVEADAGAPNDLLLITVNAKPLE